MQAPYRMDAGPSCEAHVACLRRAGPYLHVRVSYVRESCFKRETGFKENSPKGNSFKGNSLKGDAVRYSGPVAKSEAVPYVTYVVNGDVAPASPKAIR